MIAVGLTDPDWFDWCRTRLIGGEINYWTPTPWGVRRLNPGDRWYFLLKEYYPVRLIGGFGHFLRYEEVPIQIAWQLFGVRNGCASLEELIERLARITEKRSKAGPATKDSTIGCVVLGEINFLDDSEFLDMEALGMEFPRQVVKFKYFDTDSLASPLALLHHGAVPKITAARRAVDTASVFVERPAAAPNLDLPPVEGDAVAVQVDYVRRTRENIRLGREGERYVIDVERSRLNRAGRSDLADQVEWVSSTEGDGLGYDVSSFETDGRTRLVEVKTTTGPAGTRFYVTSGEVACSRRHPKEYHLYRLFDWNGSKRIWVQAGPLDHAFELVAVSYRAGP